MSYIQEYTISYQGEVFTTEWYDYDNHFQNGMVVINNRTHRYSVDGVNWIDIQTDNL